MADDCARFTFRVRCGKGTYVRTLSVDLGTKLGYASHMSKLERTGSAGMDLADALTLEEISSLVAENDFSFLQPIERGIGDLPVVELKEEQVQAATFGRFVELNAEAERLAGFHDGQLIAIFENATSCINRARFWSKKFLNNCDKIENMNIRTIKHYSELNQEKPTVLVLGYFDGIHLGHKALLDRARQVADEKDCQ